MNLPTRTIKDYSDTLASSDPAPGGGAATALAASQGAGLVSMVCNLTLGKAAYAEHEEKVDIVQRGAMGLQKHALELMDKDAESFGEVAKVYEMPKETPEEKALRKEAMEKALKGCTIPPIEVMEAAYVGLGLIQAVMGKTTPHAVSDLGVAALFFKSALEGAWLNVQINLSHIDDGEFCKIHQTRGETLLADACPVADRLYQEVLSGVKA